MMRVAVRLALALYAALNDCPEVWNRPVASRLYLDLASFIGDRVAMLSPREQQTYKMNLTFHRLYSEAKQ